MCDNYDPFVSTMLIMKRLLTLIASLSLTLCASLHADINQHFNKIKGEPQRLYSFLKAMPKGGELHYHLAGGAYPEAMIAIATDGRYCLDKTKMAVLPAQNQCELLTAKTLQSKPRLKQQIMTAWSMQGFNRHIESGHDHFFNAFDKFLPILINHNS